MKETLQNALTQLILSSITGLESAVGFLQAEIPQVIQQLLLYEGITYFLLFLFSICMLIFWFIIEKRGYSYAINTNIREYTRDQFCGYFYGIGFFVRVVYLIIFICVFNLQWLKIWIAPKLFLLEYAKHLIK